ncbi:DUF4902 domain-containing protein [Ramlibacter albus]|uniref:DUF4902 domain-containing protein n=1 Tax=Ramlibacter albus TaxID=2079448 RepID=A0A923MBY4_9BURK|nr:DUF4902 domain-containing protein [Ramlibacter albus]MBC5767568.1 DUF4902 domain-containing protein [Ramlibacter albus]
MSVPSHSFDRRVRLKTEPLRTIVFEHVCTLQDLSILDDSNHIGEPPVSAGMTEWQARFDGHLLSLSWDWMRTKDGTLIADTSVPPRSNLQPIDARGYDRTEHDTHAILWSVIGAMSWQPAARSNAPV